MTGFCHEEGVKGFCHEEGVKGFCHEGGVTWFCRKEGAMGLGGERERDRDSKEKTGEKTC